MFALTSAHQYYLHSGITDMRKGFDGLCGLVTSQFARDPASGEVFIFINKRRNQLKVLHWEQGGFVMYFKRLERGTFEQIIFDENQKCYQILWTQLVMLVEGVSMKNIKKRERYKIEK
jgi:hypothetical protein